MAAVLPGCGVRQDAGAARPPAGVSALAEQAYRAPPAITSASRGAGGRVILAGLADPGARIRAATPAGQAVVARADRRGFWRIALPGAGELRLLGLSMSQGARTIQAQGYLAVTPEGEVAQLRAGAGALVVAGPGGAVRILAVDVDRQGGAVVSGVGAPGGSVTLIVDGVARGAARVDAGRRFVLALNEPLTPGDHRLEVDQGAARVEAAVSVSPPAPLTDGPFRAQRLAAGWRIDWLTPGGGLQSTLIFARGGPQI